MDKQEGLFQNEVSFKILYKINSDVPSKACLQCFETYHEQPKSCRVHGTISNDIEHWQLDHYCKHVIYILVTSNKSFAKKKSSIWFKKGGNSKLEWGEGDL